MKTLLHRLSSTCQTPPQQGRGTQLEENQEEDQEQGTSAVNIGKIMKICIKIIHKMSASLQSQFHQVALFKRSRQSYSTPFVSFSGWTFLHTQKNTNF